MKVLVLLPTYNEKENIVKLIEKIFVAADFADILVIDDNSPDGTWHEVRQAFAGNTKVHLIKNERKLGLGMALITGFIFARKHGYGFVVTMDADFSHDPAVIPRIVEKAKDFDIVIGSRYVAGGRIDNIRLYRLFISKMANLICRVLFGFKCTDCSSGFRGYKAEIFEKLNLNEVVSNGYSAIEEILYQCQLLGYRIGEIPIVFGQRKGGVSKLTLFEITRSFSEIFEYWLNLKMKLIRHRISAHYRHEMDYEDFAEYVKTHPVSLTLRECARLKILKGYDIKGPILDAGCGDGIFIKLLSLNEECWGVDVDPREAEIARASGVYSKIIVGDLAKVNLPNGFFETCIANCSLEHLCDLGKALDNISASLKTGARIYIFLPPHGWKKKSLIARFLNKLGLKGLSEIYKNKMNNIWKHKNIHDIRHWDIILSARNLKMLEGRQVISVTNTYIFEMLMPFAFFGFLLKKTINRWILLPSLRRAIIWPSSILVNYLYRAIGEKADGAEYFIICKKR